MLRAQPGKEFKAAAKFYDRFKGRVHLVDRNDPSLTRYVSNENSIQVAGQNLYNPETDQTDIYLYAGASGADLALTAAHETLHPRFGWLHIIPEENKKLNDTDWRLFQELSPTDRAGATWNAARLRLRGYPIP